MENDLDWIHNLLSNITKMVEDTKKLSKKSNNWGL